MESGTRLGPYKILEQLGAGGMGQVWLAQDARRGSNLRVPASVDRTLAVESGHPEHPGSTLADIATFQPNGRFGVRARR